MNKRFIGVLIFAFIVAAGGGLLTYRSLLSRPAAQKAQAPTVKVVLASRDLPVGTVLSEKDVALTDWGGAVPGGASTHVQDFVGRGVISPIYSKEPVLESRLAAKGSGGGLASLIPEGMRAFAVRVNDVVGVAGFAVPGMRVDVVIEGNLPGGSPMGTLARTLFQNIEVLTAGQEFQKTPDGKPIVTQVVTLLVTPEQAEKLALAANQTTIQLVLRNPVDRKVAQVPGAALAGLFGMSAAKPAVAAAPPPPRPPEPPRVEVPKKAPAYRMEIITGTAKKEMSFESRGEGQ